MHVAAERGVDMEEAVARVASMFSQEREEWSDCEHHTDPV